MASTSTCVLVVVVGLVVAAGVYSVLSTPEESQEDTMMYSSGIYSYSITYSCDDSDYLYLGVSTYVDGSDSLDKVYILSVPDDSFTTISLDGTSYNLTITLADSSTVTFDFEVLDGEDHSVKCVMGYYGGVQMARYSDGPYGGSTTTLTFDLAADGSSTDVTLLLSNSSFISTLSAVVVFVLFLTAALMLYAAGGRR